MSSSQEEPSPLPPLTTITIDIGKPLRLFVRLASIPVLTFLRVAKLDEVFVVERAEMGAARRERERDSEERGGLLESESASEDIYGDSDDEDENVRFTPEEQEEPIVLSSKARLLQRGGPGSGVKYARSINALTKLSLCISGWNSLVLITALIIMLAGDFRDLGSWNGSRYHRYKGEVAIGLLVSFITTVICFVSALRNSKKPMTVGVSGFLDLVFVSVLFPMAIYAVTVGFPTENWCYDWGSCLKLVKAEKVLVVFGAVFGFLLRYALHIDSTFLPPLSALPSSLSHRLAL
ncbi:hypothetical protein ONS96_007446 [Cadophora gregata f. sp. sojae]|nr:hypothetical protein ONS96_007446 [Cadophora gregata f. sp. sojae]